MSSDNPSWLCMQTNNISLRLPPRREGSVRAFALSACNFSPLHKTVFSIPPFDRQCFTYLICILIYPSDSPSRALGPAPRTGSDLMPARHIRALPCCCIRAGTPLGTPIPPAAHAATVQTNFPGDEGGTALQHWQPLLPHPAPQSAPCTGAALAAQ